MDIKRVTSALLGIPLVILILLIGNKYVVDIVFTIVAFLGINEYFNAIAKVATPVRWVGYLSCLSIAILHVIPTEYISVLMGLSVPSVLILLFIQVIVTEMKTSFKDIAYTFLGIFYVVYFIMFIALINGTENGKILVWYAIIAAWVTDIFAYLIGKYFGKHKFSKISPKKSIEGSIAGVVGAVAIMLIYTYCVNTYFEQNLSYLYVGIVGVILSIFSQLGDFSASSIKRYVDLKDFSNLIPGHGGMLDRIDSLLFIAPLTYIFFCII